MTDGKVETVEPQKNIRSITLGDLTWVDITPSIEATREYLKEHFNFDSMSLDDCISHKQISKLNVFPDYLFFVFHYPHYDKETRISTKRQWSAFVGKGYLVTTHTGESKVLEAIFRECQTNIPTRQQYFSHGSAFLLYSVLDRMIDSYFPVLDKILGLLEDMEDAVFDEEVDVTRDLNILRRDIIAQRKVMFPTRTVFIEMKSKLHRFTDIDITTYHDDLIDHVNKICDTLDECKEIIEAFQDTDSTLATQNINRVVRILNIFATIFLPFLAVSGIYGMNVVLPGGLEPGSLSTFIILLALMVVLMLGMFFYFRHRHWI
jgi:magnesium transporter